MKSKTLRQEVQEPQGNYERRQESGPWGKEVQSKNPEMNVLLRGKKRFSWTCRKAGDSDHKGVEGSQVCCKRRGCSGCPPP